MDYSEEAAKEATVKTKEFLLSICKIADKWGESPLEMVIASIMLAATITIDSADQLERYGKL